MSPENTDELRNALVYIIFHFFLKKIHFVILIKLIHATSTDNDLKWVRNEALKEKVCFILPHTFTTLLNLVFFIFFSSTRC